MTVCLDDSITTGLANSNNILDAESINKTFIAISKLQNKAKHILVQKKIKDLEIFAFGTEALRNASNLNSFLSLFKKQFKNIPIEIISGKKEAYFLNIALSAIYKPSLAIDIGGASTEFVYSLDKTVGYATVSIGARKYSQKQYEKLLEKLNIIKTHDLNLIDKGVVITGGTASAFAAGILKQKSFSQETTEGFVINKKDLHFYLELLKKDKKYLTNFVSFDPDRKTVLISGLELLLFIQTHLGFEQFVVSNFGARFGYIVNKINNNAKIKIKWDL